MFLFFAFILYCMVPRFILKYPLSYYPVVPSPVPIYTNLFQSIPMLTASVGKLCLSLSNIGIVFGGYVYTSSGGKNITSTAIMLNSVIRCQADVATLCFD